MVDKCKARVSVGDWGRTHQCRRSAKKDGFCMIHHPESIAARDKKAQESYEKKRDASPIMRLIAVTKQRDELLAALEKAVSEYEKLPHSLGYEFTHLPEMRAAIAKARGQQ